MCARPEIGADKDGFEGDFKCFVFSAHNPSNSSIFKHLPNQSGAYLSDIVEYVRFILSTVVVFVSVRYTATTQLSSTFLLLN